MNVKYMLIVLSLLCIFACNENATTTWTPPIISIEAMPSANRVVCNEFDVAYYEFKTTHNHFVYSPVYIHYSGGGVNAISCEDYSNYIEMKEKKYGKVPR